MFLVVRNRVGHAAMDFGMVELRASVMAVRGRVAHLLALTLEPAGERTHHSGHCDIRVINPP